MRGCRQTALSPDAKYFACFGNALDLTLFDVGTGETIFKKEHFFDFDAGFSGYFGLFKFIYLLTHRNVATLSFSPDAHYFDESSRTQVEINIDLATNTNIT